MTPSDVLRTYRSGSQGPAARPVPAPAAAVSEPAPAPARRRARGYVLLLAGLLVLGAVLPAIGSGTGASFTATSSNASNLLANGTVSMTNVAGSVISGSNCSTSVISGTCATLFASSNTGFKPGAADVSNTATITYTGSISTSDFRLYGAGYTSKGAGSSSFCTAANPGSKVDLQVVVGGVIIYPTSGSGYGTLDGFATTYTSPASGLQLKGGTNGSGTAGVWANGNSGVYTINLHLDSTADNTYQGCQSQSDLVWYATQ
jgi:hypothetical protein